MKIALIMENSQAAKNEIVYKTLKNIVEPLGHTVDNYGMEGAEDNSLTYVQNGLLAGILLNSGACDFVVTGCGTGIPEAMIKEAISLGVCKINVNTECQLAFAAATRKYIEEGKDQVKKGFDPRKLLAPGAEAIKQTVLQKMEMFGSVGKAN